MLNNTSNNTEILDTPLDDEFDRTQIDPFCADTIINWSLTWGTESGEEGWIFIKII